MESAAVMRSFHCAVGTIAQVNSLVEKPTVVPMYMAASKARRGTYLRCIKASESTLAAKSDGVALDSRSQRPLEKKKRATTFPKGFEALVLEVCDGTEVAELKLKVGDFEMSLRRNIGATKTASTPLTHPPVPSEPMVESAPAPSPPALAPAPAPSKATSSSGAPFKNVSTTKSPKLIALEASGASGYVLVPSPTVGEFQRGRFRKGKHFPPACKEKCPDQPVPKVESGTGGALGDVIKEGKVIGYVAQFGTQIQVTSDVDGEVLKVLFDEGDAVGYGDPILAVLPFFHDIK